MEAKNPKNKKNFSKAIAWLIKYNGYNEQRNTADDNDDAKEYRKYDRLCESSFDKFSEFLEELPKYERARIESSFLY